nr:hypothetical protein [Tanacetum cinerariifolium]
MAASYELLVYQRRISFIKWVDFLDATAFSICFFRWVPISGGGGGKFTLSIVRISFGILVRDHPGRVTPLSYCGALATSADPIAASPFINALTLLNISSIILERAMPIIQDVPEGSLKGRFDSLLVVLLDHCSQHMDILFNESRRRSVLSQQAGSMGPSCGPMPVDSNPTSGAPSLSNFESTIFLLSFQAQAD